MPSRKSIERSIGRLQERINELLAFDIARVPEGSSPQLTALSAAIRDTLDRCFGEGSAKIERFVAATDLQFRPMGLSDNYPLRHHYQEGAEKKISTSVALLREAQRTLNEDLTDEEHGQSETAESIAVEPLSRKIFVVHGHEEGPREAVARFLEKIGLEPVILHERANRGRTIIEKIEAHSGVGFVIVLLTPDDEGCVKGGAPEPRARQNVLLELGYFLGLMGRSKVCALKKGQVEIPSDFAGVVWESMDEGAAWQQGLARELQDAGYQIDWNVVMKSLS